MNKRNKSNQGSISVGGNVSGKGIAIGHNAHAESNEGLSISEIETQNLSQLIETLIAQLEKIPPGNANDVEAIKTMATSLESATKTNISKPILEIQAEGLKKAAEVLRDVAPAVFTVATQIVANIMRL